SMKKWSGAKNWSQAPRCKHLQIPKATPLLRQLYNFIEVMERKVTPLISVFGAQKTLQATFKIEALVDKKRRSQILDTGKDPAETPVKISS
ncbi:MAG: hypothetical protein P8M25_11910, partial [Paracoccaceae bacterium]|nr:hypothetical protein [Paracoccaceae bacterium]